MLRATQIFRRATRARIHRAIQRWSRWYVRSGRFYEAPLAYWALIVAIAALAGCGPIKVNTNPSAPRPIGVNFTQPISAVTVWFDGAGVTDQGPFSATVGRVGFPQFPGAVTIANVHIRADGYQPYDCVTAIPGGSYDFFVGVGPVGDAYGQGWFVGQNGSTCARSLTPTLPAPPTRDQALAVNVSFQGTTCHTDQFGDEPLFTPSVPWHTPSDRQKIYACVKAEGRTHIDLVLPSGPPLYDECCQFYTADKFPAKDWTANQTAIDPALAALVVEVRQAGLIPILHMAEQQPISTWEIGAVLDALATSAYGDLRRQVGVYLPGYDGIFYGWEPSHDLIPAWAAVGRTHCSDCQLGIEFNIGHIPLGEGDQDYVSGGDMRGYDALFIEFQDDGLVNNNTFGIVERLIGPRYIRPVSDAPPNDGGDSHPRPWILATPTDRGPWAVVCFEFDTYPWVRFGISADAVQAHRAFLNAMGCSGIG